MLQKFQDNSRNDKNNQDCKEKHQNLEGDLQNFWQKREDYETNEGKLGKEKVEYKVVITICVHCEIVYNLNWKKKLIIKLCE